MILLYVGMLSLLLLACGAMDEKDNYDVSKNKEDVKENAKEEDDEEHFSGKKE